MNDERFISDEELELATSRRLPGDRALADEAAAAREAFLAMGSAVEADAPMLDEQALVQRIVGRLNSLDAADGWSADASVGLRPPVSEPVDRANHNAGWHRFMALMVTGTLAAAACFVMFRVPLSPVTHDQEPPKVAVAETPEISIPGNATPDSEIPESVTVPAVEPSALAWNDPLDEEIAMAAAAMSRMSASRRDVDVSLYDMNEVLSALSAELAGESL